MSFGIGTQLAIAAIGLTSVLIMVVRGRGAERKAERGSLGKVCRKDAATFPGSLRWAHGWRRRIGYVIC